MGDHEVSYLVVSIYDKKIRMNYASNDLTLSQIVEDAFIDYLTFEEGLDEVDAASKVKEKPLKFRGILNSENHMIKARWTIKEAGLKSGDTICVQFLGDQIAKNREEVRETDALFKHGILSRYSSLQSSEGTFTPQRLSRYNSLQDGGESSEFETSINASNQRISENHSLEHSSTANSPSSASSLSDTAGPSKNDFTQYNQKEILECTNNFSNSRLVGRGGQSEVYRGVLRGTEVAVKRFKEGRAQDMVREVELSPRHPQVVLILGFCVELSCVVSEFMAGGSLQDRLNGGMEKGEGEWQGEQGGIPLPPLSLMECLRVGADVASALQHLHSAHVAHRDLKPANVLLSSHMPDGNRSRNGREGGRLRAKLADLGLARHVMHSRTEWGLQGTAGYVDPFYAERGRVSKTSDVYSLGLILIQALTQEKDVKTVHDTLAKCPGQPRDLEAALREFSAYLTVQRDNNSSKCAEASLWLALQCVERNPQYRPSLDSFSRQWRNIVEVMEGEMDFDLNSFKEESRVVPNLENWTGEALKTLKLSEETSQPFRSLKGIPEREMTERIGTVNGKRMLMGRRRRKPPLKPGLADGTALSVHTPEEQYIAGQYYEFGEGIEKDLDLAYYWYSQGCSSGHVPSSVACGRFLADGIGRVRDLAEAISKFRKGVEEGNLVAFLRLAYHSFEGIGLKKDTEKAHQLARIGLAGKDGCNDDPAYLYSAGICFQYGIGTAIDPQVARDLYWQSSERSYAPACFKIAESILSAEKVNPNSKKDAIKFLLFAARDGYPEAEFRLGLAYKDGVGAKKDLREATDLFRKAAKKGHPAAQASLAKCLARGEGVTKDEAKALYYYESAAVQGYCFAQYALGICYRDGVGTERDWRASLDWLARAAKQSRFLPPEERSKGKEAEAALKQMLDDLQYRAKSFAMTEYGKHAASLIGRMAGEGFPIAQYSFGLCFLNGWGVDENREKAIEYLRKAQIGGHKGASDKMKKLLGSGSNQTVIGKFFSRSSR